VNTVSELASTAPSPITTTNSWNIRPVVFPTTVASAALRPTATPRLTTNSTLGPGITIST
jgi:hypothetical protein